MGPRFLERLVSYLQTRADSPLLRDYEWWIVPHANPDGEERNRGAFEEASFEGARGYEPCRYLTHVVRELPGDDMEFGFPRDASDAGARPENRAIADWWRTAGSGLSTTPCSLSTLYGPRAWAF